MGAKSYRLEYCYVNPQVHSVCCEALRSAFPVQSGVPAVREPDVGHPLSIAPASLQSDFSMLPLLSCAEFLIFLLT